MLFSMAHAKAWFNDWHTSSDHRAEIMSSFGAVALASHLHETFSDTSKAFSSCS